MMRELVLQDLSLWTYLWQSTAFVALGLVAGWLLRRRPSRAYQVLLLAMMAAVAVPLLSAAVKHFDLGAFVATETELAPVFREMPLATSAPAPQTRAREIAPREFVSPVAAAPTPVRVPWRMVMLCGWMAATLVLLGRLVVTFLYGVHLVRRASGTRCETIQQAADRMGSRLGMACGLQVRAGRRIRSPIVWCWSRQPILLVPDHGENPRLDWTGVVAHELAHRARRDHVTGLAAELSASLLPWNPLMWVSKRYLVRLGEQACDDWVVAVGAPSEDYAESLLHFRPQRQMAFLPAVVHSKKGLAARVRRILSDTCGNPHAGVKWAVIAGLIAACVGVGVAFAQTRPGRTDAADSQSEEPASLLHQAVAAGDSERVASLLSKGIDVNAKDDKGNTPLHLAARYGYKKKDIAELLIANGADVNARNADGWTPLHFTAWRRYTGHEDITELLVKNGADIEARDREGRMPLHYAARRDSPNVVALFLTAGIDINVGGSRGWTAMHEAANCLVDSVVELLLAQGADVNVKDAYGRTALHTVAGWYGPSSAKERGSALRRIVERLVTAGADINAKDSEGRVPLHAAASAGQDEVIAALLADGADVNARAKDGETPLHYAACSFRLQEDALEVLIANGADVNAKTDIGETPIALALRVNYQANHQQAVDLLAARGSEMPPTRPLLMAARSGDLAKVKSFLEKGPGVSSGGEPDSMILRAAAGAGQKEVAEFLISKGADVTGKDRFGWTALHCAAYAGSKDVVQLLLREGAEVNAPNRRGEMPLNMALRRGHEDVAKILVANGAREIQMGLFDAARGGHVSVAKRLIREGANVNAEDAYSDTPLHYAVWRPQHKEASLEIAELLLDHGANPNARDCASFAPLHYAAGAANCASPKMAELLVRKGADVNLNNGWGGTPLSIAKKNGYTDIADLLRSHGARE